MQAGRGTSVPSGKVITTPDPTAAKRLADAKAKFDAAKSVTRAVSNESHKYETEPSVIAWTITKGPQKGKEMKSVGFRSLANPESSYLAVKLRARDARAVLACIDAGQRDDLEALLTVLTELQQESTED